MKDNLRVAVISFVFLFSLFLPELNAQQEIMLGKPDITISMDFQDASMKDILKLLSLQSGLNFIASQAVQDRKVTLYLENVPLKDAMDKIFKANNLSYDLDKKANIFIVKDWGVPEMETVTKVFYFKYATVTTSSLKQEMSNQITNLSDITSATGSGGSSGGSSGGGGEGSSSSGGNTSGGKWKTEEEAGITAAVKKLLSENGSLIEDYRTNSLIVTDTPSRMEIITNVIAALDVSIPQIMLEVEMLDVSKNVVDNLGFDFTNAGSFAMQVVSASRSTAFPLSSFIPTDGLPGKTFTPGTVSFPTTLKLIFDWLSTQTDTKFLARPRLLTLNNETAEIRIATNESIGIKTTIAGEGSITSSTAEAERALTGVILRVTPQVNVDTGEVTMFVYPKVCEAVAGNQLTSGSQTFQYRDPEERSTKSFVKLKDGETVVIGGLLSHEVHHNSDKLPILGNIPIIGALFRHSGNTANNTTEKNKERELLVFITPLIIKDSAKMEIAQANKINIPQREQNAYTGFDRLAVVDTSLNNFEKNKK